MLWKVFQEAKEGEVRTSFQTFLQEENLADVRGQQARS